MIYRKLTQHLVPLNRAVLGLILLILPILAFASQSEPSAYAIAPCTVDYSIVNQWNTGFQVNVSITPSMDGI